MKYAAIPNPTSRATCVCQATLAFLPPWRFAGCDVWLGSINVVLCGQSFEVTVSQTEFVSATANVRCLSQGNLEQPFLHGLVKCESRFSFLNVKPVRTASAILENVSDELNECEPVPFGFKIVAFLKVRLMLGNHLMSSFLRISSINLAMSAIAIA